MKKLLFSFFSLCSHVFSSGHQSSLNQSETCVFMNGKFLRNDQMFLSLNLNHPPKETINFIGPFYFVSNR